MILNDLQKAFDTLDHQILLKNLKYIGFSSETVKRFEPYSKTQNLIVKIEQNLSKPAVLNYGVAQGSILGPILFYCM